MSSTTPPRPIALFMRMPTSVPANVQFSTSIFFTSRDISLPITNPPWPSFTMQSCI